MKNCNMQYNNDKGQRMDPEETKAFSWKLKKLPDERAYSLDNGSDNFYKAQQDALREWALRMRW